MLSDFNDRVDSTCHFVQIPLVFILPHCGYKISNLFRLCWITFRRVFPHFRSSVNECSSKRLMTKIHNGAISILCQPTKPRLSKTKTIQPQGHAFAALAKRVWSSKNASYLFFFFHSRFTSLLPCGTLYLLIPIQKKWNGNLSLYPKQIQGLRLSLLLVCYFFPLQVKNLFKSSHALKVEFGILDRSKPGFT